MLERGEAIRRPWYIRVPPNPSSNSVKKAKCYSLNPSRSLGGGCTPLWTTFFYNSRTTCAILVKLCPSQQNLVRNILKSKCPPHVTSEYAQMVYFLGQSDFTDQDLQGKTRTMPYLGIQRWYQLETFTSKPP